MKNTMSTDAISLRNQFLSNYEKSAGAEKAKEIAGNKNLLSGLNGFCQAISDFINTNDLNFTFDETEKPVRISC